MTLPRLSTPLRLALRSAPLIALLAALPCHAQYKVVGPDGKITYTDRPPPAGDAKVAPVSTKSAGAAASDASLPSELRQAAARYPVTLYTAASGCEPCTASRQLLRQRGIPYTEKQVASPEDNDALERLSGARDVPTLSIGSQVLRGLSSSNWNSYLDAAGYPRESRLPANYQYPAPSPVADRPAPRAAAEAPAPAAPPVANVPSPSNPTGIKF